MPGLSGTLLALIVAQVCVHAAMTGVRMALPLQALRMGMPAWAVGALLALVAVAPIALALPAGRLADRHGYHLPMRLAVTATSAGAAFALLATLIAPMVGRWALLPMALAAVGVGAGANIGLITIQRTAGRGVAGTTELKRIFSWLGLAPAFANVVGPVVSGALIDLGGFAAAYAVLLLMPFVAWQFARRVPRETPAAPRGDGVARRSWDLLATPGLRRLLFVNWLLSSAWDIHSLLVPVLGHERGFSASAIGLVLGIFAAAVTGVRLLIPVLAHRLRESQVLAGAMLWAAGVLALYPLAHSAVWMAVAAGALGLALGAVQPMIMTALHQLTPHERHGEAIALRSMTINLSSATMPMLFGALGAAIGAGPLFWMMAGALAAGSWPARRVGRLVD